LANDAKTPAVVRLQVLRLLDAKPDAKPEAKAALLAATADGNDPDVRILALQLLEKSAPSDAFALARRFLEVKGAKTAEKQTAVAVVFSSTEAAAAPLRLSLVGKLSQGKFDDALRWDVFSAAQRSTEPAIKQALQAYIALPRQPTQLAAPGLPYELIVAGGDASRGRAIALENLAANCTACHRFESDEGSEVGPALNKVGDQRLPAELAESLVQPSAKIVPGFGLEVLTLKDGTTLSGNVLEEDKQLLRLRQADGTRKDVPLAAVAERTPPISVMPPMAAILSPAELRDVVAYLASLKAKPAKTAKEKK
jgi:putative heme-binding domain-containing protein